MPTGKVDQVGEEEHGTPHAGGEARVPGLGTVYAVGLCLAVIATALFVLAVQGLAGSGASLAEGLDEQLGEVAFKRAQALANEGKIPEALDEYVRALGLAFEDMRQRGFALREYARLLVGEGRPEDALPLLEECLASYDDDLVAHGLYCSALRGATRHEDLLNAAQQWLDSATRMDSTSNRAHALFHRGAALESLGRKDDALDAYLEGYTTDPATHNGYHAAVMLHERGEAQRAFKVLLDYIEVGAGWRLDSAKELLARIQAERAA